VKTVAVSISDSAELAKYGLCQLHEQTLSDEIHLSLLMSGLQIAYGGRLDPPAAGRANNFTLRLFDLVRGYSGLASNAGTKLEPILNIPPWPLWLTYNDSIMRLFGKVARLTKGKRPSIDEIPEVDETGSELFPANANPFALPDTPLRRLAWTRGLTLMRQQMTTETQARIVIGGKLFGFSGIYPGVVEEAWFSLISKRPLYLVGFLGGAARAVIDLLEGRDRAEVSEPKLGPKAPSTSDVIALAQSRGLMIVSPDSPSGSADLTGKLVHPARLASDIMIAGTAGIGAALNNGLSDAQNQELFRSTDPTRIATLVLEGLSHLHGTAD
jgi:SLOG cluster2